MWVCMCVSLQEHAIVIHVVLHHLISFKANFLPTVYIGN